MAQKIRMALRFYSALLLILKIAVAAMILLAILAVAAEEVSLENIGEPFVVFDGEDLVINVPVTIKNYGFYSIDNISVSYSLRNKTSMLLSGHDMIGKIPTGSIDTFTVPVSIDLAQLYHEEYPGLYHFKHSDIFNANITISLLYMMKWVKISVTTQHEFKWIPPLEDIRVYNPTNVSMDSKGALKFRVPFLLKTASYLHGSAHLSGILESHGEKCGYFNATAELGEAYYGDIMMEVSKNYTRSFITESQDLNMVGNISLFGYGVPFSYHYHWGAPLANLTYKVLPNETLYYSFTDESPYSLSMKVTKIFYYHGNEVSRDVSEFYVHAGQHIERYEKLSIAQPVDEVKIIFYEANTHISYEEVITV